MMAFRLLPLILLVSAALSGCRKEKETSAGGAPSVDGELVVTAILREIPGAFPANDIYNYAYVMRYEVKAVHKGTWGDADILVGHYNPRLARDEVKDEQDAKVGGNVKGFQVGDAHFLVLSPLEGQWTGALEDDFFKDKRPRHWALWTDKAQ